MSDALTDIARDQRRVERLSNYLKAVKTYLISPTKENLDSAIKSAEEVDGVRGGYGGGGRTALSNDAEKRLKKLRRGNKKEWSKFLSLILDLLQNNSPNI